MIKATLPERGIDAWGDGSFGASRGDRKHKGIDFACYPGTLIHTPVRGRVTKLGYPYADDLSFRYVEIRFNNVRHRLFYVEPDCVVGDYVEAGDYIGEAQDIAGRYSTPDQIMLNHVHYEILDSTGTPIDPKGD